MDSLALGCRRFQAVCTSCCRFLSAVVVFRDESPVHGRAILSQTLTHTLHGHFAVAGRPHVHHIFGLWEEPEDMQNSMRTHTHTHTHRNTLGGSGGVRPLTAAPRNFLRLLKRKIIIKRGNCPKETRLKSHDSNLWVCRGCITL